MTSTTGTISRGVLTDQRRSLSIWAVAVAAVSAMYASVYTSVGASDWDSMLESMPADLMEAMGFDNISTAAGYITSTVYSLLGIVLLLVYGIAQGSKLIAGAEEAGTLELEFTSPATRTQIYRERLVALWVGLAALAAAVTVTIMALNAALSLDLSYPNLLGIGLLLWLTSGLFSTLGLAVGAATGHKGLATGVAAGVAVLAYMFNAMGPMTENTWMSTISPFNWYLGSDPLTTGMDWLGAALLLSASLLCAAGGYLAITRRDLMV